MSETSDLAPADRRANWVALRTLRQRPTVVGRTEQGDTIYEIRSVRLVLVGGAGHFSQLVECSKCARAMAGRPVITTADLDRPSIPMICGQCVGAPASAPQQAPTPGASPAEATSPAAVAGADAERTDASTDLAPVLAEIGALARMQEALDQRVLQLAEKVEQLGNAERESIDARLDADRQRLHAAVAEGLAGLRAMLAAQERRFDDQSSRQDALEVKLGAALEERSAQLPDLAQEQAVIREEIERRLAGVEAWAGAAAARQEAVEQSVTAAVADLRRLVEDHEDALRRGRGRTIALVDSLDEQLRAAAKRLSER